LGPSRQSDGLLDVVVVYGALHLGQLSWGTDRPVRVCQASSVTLTVDETFPVHVDGQPWEQSACVMEVGLKNRVALLASGDAEARMRASGGGAGAGTKIIREGLEEWWTEWLDARDDRAGGRGGKKKKEGELTFGWEHWEDLDFYDDLEGGARAFVCFEMGVI
jgi:diacylglycerol kinase (ATP)